MRHRWTAFLAGLLLTCQAHANVLYTWHAAEASAGALPHSLVLEIGFTDAALAAGRVDYTIDNCLACAPDPDAPVTHFLFDGVTPAIRFLPQVEPMPPFARLKLALEFEPGGYLSGAIFADDTQSQLALSSDGLLFTIDGVRSDVRFGGGCDLWSDDCKGATGYLRAGTIPEPNAMLLFVIAMIGLLIANRPRRD